MSNNDNDGAIIEPIQPTELSYDCPLVFYFEKLSNVNPPIKLDL